MKNSHNVPAIITFKHNNTYEIWNMININILKPPHTVQNPSIIKSYIYHSGNRHSSTTKHQINKQRLKINMLE